MTQWEFETIVKVLELGAPALARSLANSLNNLVIERNKLAQELEGLKNSGNAEPEKAAEINDKKKN